MSDRSRAPIAITATRIGRTDLGAGSVLIDDDAITVMVRAREGEKHIRMPLVSVDAVVRGSGEVSLDLRDGSRLTLVSEGADRVGHDVLLRCHALPEVTRALRAFGSSRGRRGSRATAASDQQRFFAPLLEARRKAGGAGGPAAVMAAFDAPALKQSFDETGISIFPVAYGSSSDQDEATKTLQSIVDFSKTILVKGDTGEIGSIFDNLSRYF